MLDLKKVFGPVLTLLGTIVLLFACVAFLSGGEKVLGLSVSKTESAVPFIVGLIFFLSGINLIKNS
jgi:hypothetical protein